MVRVFANGPGDLGSILGRIIPKTQKIVLDATLLNTQRYKVKIKGKVEQSRERNNTLPYSLIEKGAFWSPSTTVANFTLYIYIYIYIYCNPETDCFVVSQLFSVARHARNIKPWSKPA